MSEDSNRGNSNDPLSLNLYTYCKNNPILYFDRTGNWPDLVQWWKDVTKEGKADWFLWLSLGTDKDENGIYHIRQNWWQSWNIVGYRDEYDTVFDAACDMDSKKFGFTYNDVEFMLWAWKGDYINLGAGAEMGIYYGGGPKWKTGTQYAIPMTLQLIDNESGKQFFWDPGSDNPQWWITGFDPSNQGVLASNLTAIYTLDFSGDTGMYYAFYDAWYGKDDRLQFDDKKHTATFTF